MDTFRFGIMGAGNIAGRFCSSVSLLNDCQVISIASKSKERAKRFAEAHNLDSFYDSYEEMLKEEKPDCVYIATTVDTHFELCMLCLQYDTPILCEKAMFLNSRDTNEVFQLAKEKQIFVMEAMWSRFLPAVLKAKEWIDDHKIGKITYAEIGIGFLAPKDKENRYFSPKLGGGVRYDITVYAYELMTYLITMQIRDIQTAIIWGETGVDISSHITLQYEDMIASLKTSFVAPMEERFIIYGEKGKIEIPFPHYASQAFLFDSQMEVAEHYKDEETTDGMIYEIMEVMECIHKGYVESSIAPHNMTLECSKLFDRIEDIK